MDASSSPPPALQRHSSPLRVSTLESHSPAAVDSCSTAEISSPKPTSNCGNNENKKNYNKDKKRGKKKRVTNEYVSFAEVSSSSCCSSSPDRAPRVMRLACRRRNPTVRFGAVRRSLRWSDVEAMALPLGMSVAVFVNKVLDRKDRVSEQMSINELIMICTSAIRESLVNVYGDKFDCFLKNFERSFGSTLRTLSLMSDSFVNKGRCHLRDLHLRSFTSEFICQKGGTSESNSDMKEDFATVETQSMSSAAEEVQGRMLMDSVNPELELQPYMNQIICVPPSSLPSVINQTSFVEKSLMEQTRANDLKAVELGLAMEKLKLKKTEIVQNFESNHLQRSKLAMGVSKAAFEAEKFKTQLEDIRHNELLKKCIDCLVAGLFIMSFSLLYGAYVYSYKRIADATMSCIPSSEESRSWWIPKQVTSFNSGWNTLKCQVLVVSRMLFGFFMIITIAYLLIQRSGASNQTMPVTVILLLLGTACGFAGKFCVDALGGSGYHWLLFWETLCLFHFFSNVCKKTLFLILYGPVTSEQGTKGGAVVPYWIRQSLFYAIVPLFLPLSCGLIPFASLGEWKDHFLEVISNYLLVNGDLS